MNYYIADLHFGHNNIIKHSNRPFQNAEEMDKAMINNWNNTVRPDDNVYIIGDFCYKNSRSPVEYLRQLKGKKYLITGNHDRFSDDASTYFQWIKDYAEIIDGNNRVVLFHYPMVEWSGFFRGSIHLYGHIHNNVSNETYQIMKNIPNAYNVGADILGYTPRTLEQVMNFNKNFLKNH